LVDTTSTAGERLGFALWVVAADLLVDWVALPLVALVGWAVSRWVPARGRAPVQVGLLLSGSVLVVAWLPLRGTAAVANNPTIQPLDYGPAVAATLAVVWVLVGLWALRRRAVASG
jgi:hypothetical protein